MAAAAAEPVESDTDCPVCHDGFIHPKLLPCAHLVCHKCVLAWLRKLGCEAGCPLCRRPILPASDSKGQDDVASLVDALPTDFATEAIAESQKTLSESHVCSCCDDAEGSLFCLQCAIKLCANCAKIHAKIPSSRDHVTERLSDLSAGRLAAHRPIGCGSHSAKPAELFCSSHCELVCLLCASSTHRHCPELKGLDDVAGVKREELGAQAKKLQDRETAIVMKIAQLDAEVPDARTKFKAMRDEVKGVFDELQSAVEARRQQLSRKIEERECVFLAEREACKKALESYRGELSAHRVTAERLASSAPNNSLLATLGKVMSRLASVETQRVPDNPESTTGSLVLDAVFTGKTKEAIAANGELADSSEAQRVSNARYRCLLCGIPRGTIVDGPKFAAVIKVGDRVRRGRDWQQGCCQDGSPPGPGTVTYVPDDLKSQTVTVQWDCQINSDRYYMGRTNTYRLRLDTDS